MRGAAWTLVAASVGLVVAAAVAADPGAAERQYALARRLAAEGSPQAAEALRKVVTLDPEGVLADDAIVDEALLEGLPGWSSELGALDPEALALARRLLSRVADEMPAADRAPEALYRRALLRLEPQAGYAPTAARVDLLAVAANPNAGEWAPAARVALGDLAAAAGDEGPARDAWSRVVVDAPGGPAAARAAAGLGGLALRAGRADEAAHWFEQARETGEDIAAATVGIELAVRRLLPAPGAPVRPSSTRTLDGLRGVSIVATAPGGGLAVYDRRAGVVVRFDADGAAVSRVELDDVQALAFGPDGGLVAAAGDDVWRLPAGGSPVLLGRQGEYGPATAVAAGPLGVVWLLDRRGEEVGRLEPGQAAPRPVWSQRGTRLAGLSWDGRRLLAAEPKTDRVVVLDPAGRTVSLGGEFVRIGALAADRSGRVAVVDSRAGMLVIMDADGTELTRLGLAGLGVERPAAIGLDAAGRVHLWEEGSSRWVVLP